MKKELIIIMALFAMMTGVTSAFVTTSPTNVQVDVITASNPPTVVSIIYDPQGYVPAPSGLGFNIRNGKYPNSGLYTIDLTGSVDGGSTYVGNSGILPVVAPDVDGKYIWTFYVKDATDSDDSTQNGKQYNINFEVLGTADSTSFIITSTPTIATAIPEFPIVALPVAAIIGLVFFFQSRKDKDKED